MSVSHLAPFPVLVLWLVLNGVNLQESQLQDACGTCNCVWIAQTYLLTGGRA